MGRICCFTGYRPHRFPFSPDGLRPEQVQRALGEQIRRLVDEGYDTFISGMCVGVDLWAAAEVIALQSLYPHIRLIAAVPFEGQDANWPQSVQREYRHLLACCQQVEVLFEGPPHARLYLQRNRWMVDRADTVLAVFDRQGGGDARSGTAATVRYARRCMRRLLFIHPTSLCVSEDMVEQIQFPLE